MWSSTAAKMDPFRRILGPVTALSTTGFPRCRESDVGSGTPNRYQNISFRAACPLQGEASAGPVRIQRRQSAVEPGPCVIHREGTLFAPISLRLCSSTGWNYIRREAASLRGPAAFTISEKNRRITTELSQFGNVQCLLIRCKLPHSLKWVRAGVCGQTARLNA